MTEEQKSLPETINFDYIKSNQFRVIHADGAFFALTTHNGLSISFFAERQPIPRRTVHKVRSDGTLGDEIREERVVRDAIVRDAEVAVIMTLQTAQNLKDKLEEMIQKAEDVAKQVEELKKS